MERQVSSFRHIRGSSLRGCYFFSLTTLGLRTLFSNQLATKSYYEQIFKHPIDDLHKAMPMEATMMAHAGRNCSYGPHLYGGFKDGFYISHLDGRMGGARAKKRIVHVGGITLDVLSGEVLNATSR